MIHISEPACHLLASFEFIIWLKVVLHFEKYFCCCFHKCSCGRHLKRLKWQTFLSTLGKVHVWGLSCSLSGKAHATMESYKKCGVGIILKHVHGPGIGVYPGCRCWLGRQVWSKSSGPGGPLGSLGTRGGLGMTCFSFWRHVGWGRCFLTIFHQAGESRVLCGYQGHTAWLLLLWTGL